MARSLTSSLIMELVDRVSAPARSLSKSILGINDAMRTTNGQRPSFTARLDEAIARNNAALDAARGRMVDAVAGAYALRAALAAPISNAMAMETALSGIASKANLSASEVSALAGRVRQVSGATNQFTADLLAGVDYLVGMGMSAEDAATAIETIGRATTATGGNIQDMSAAAFAAISNLKVPAAQAEGALDAMAVAGKRGGFELKDMASYMPSVAAAYAALGQDGTDAVADLAAAMQVMRADTGDASSAATNLQNVIQKTFAPGTIKKFSEKGVDLFSEMEKAAQRGLTPLEAIAEITNKTLNGDLSKLGFLFEDAQAQAGIRSLIQGMEEYRDIRAEAMAGGGTNAKDFDRAMATTEQRAKRARIALANLSTQIGSSLLPIIEALAKAITPVLDGLRTFAEENPRLVGAITATAAALVSLRVAAAALSFLGLMGRGGALSALSVAVNTVGAAVTRLGGAAKSAIALQTALGAMAGGQTLGGLSKLGTGLRAAVMAVPGVSALGSAIAAIGAAVATISAPVWGAFAVAAAAVAAAGIAIWKYWDRITAVLSGVGQALGEILAPAFEAIRPVLDWFAPLGDLIASGWEKAGAAISAVGEWLGSIFTKETLSEDDKAKAKQAGYDFVMAIWDGMKAVMSNLTSWVGSKIDEIVTSATNGLNSLAGWAASKGIGSVGNAPAGAPNRAQAFDGARAKGGPISRGGRYLVGEEGPELITASRSGYVNRAGSMGGSGAGLTVNNHMTLHVSGRDDAESIAERVARKIEEKTRAALRGLNADGGLAVY